jgi:hypothetical protein
MALLKQDRVLALHSATLSARLDRRALLAGISPSCAAQIPAAPTPAAQLLIDLNWINDVGRLTDGTAPLVTWLKAAVLLAGLRTERGVFEAALTEALAALAVASTIWMEIALAEVRVRAWGDRGEASLARRLLPELNVAYLERFAEAVRAAAAAGRPLGPDRVEQARVLHRDLFEGPISELRARPDRPAWWPLRLRLRIAPELQAIPWDLLATPSEAMGFGATFPELVPIREVITTEPWQLREVRGPVRVLAVSPGGGAAIDRLRRVLEGRIASGEVQWLEPIEGAWARPLLLDRLRRQPTPHVLHFLGPGAEAPVPAQPLAGLEGDHAWLGDERVAGEIKASCRGPLRLIVLEACPGAEPAPAAAAAILASTGVDAVLTHLWPLRSEAAQVYFEEFYRSLAGAPDHASVARSLHEARRAVLGSFEGSAEAFAPVLHVRDRATALFDFKRRALEPGRLRPEPYPGPGEIDPGLRAVLERPFSLLIGDRHDGPALDVLRGKIDGAPPSPAMPLSTLAQRFAFRRGSTELGMEFQDACRVSDPSPPLLDELARLTRPGIHVSLLRHPIFEDALARCHPDRAISVILPYDKTVAVCQRKVHGGTRWDRLAAPPKIDLDQEIVVLRLYRGLTPKRLFIAPLLTEDDYLFDFPELDSVLPRPLVDALLCALYARPALCLGLSLLVWDHRVALSRLFRRRPLGVGSLAVLDPGDPQRELWGGGAGLPGKAGVAVVEAAEDHLTAMLARFGSQPGERCDQGRPT